MQGLLQEWKESSIFASEIELPRGRRLSITELKLREHNEEIKI